MRNLHLTFSHPWLLLLLIPAVALTLIPYFRLSKRYRKTRNRITSMVLHLVVMVMAILTLSGLKFSYELVNKNNEIIILVDVSETVDSVKNSRDEFVKNVIDECQYDDFKVGVVTFGYDQVYVAEIDDDTDKVYEQYAASFDDNLPDTTATDIAAALRYAQGLFSSPESSKIVLVTDGKQTDEEALNAIRYVSAQGTRVDTVYFGSTTAANEAAVTSIKLPDRHILDGEECQIQASIKINSAEIGVKGETGGNVIYLDVYDNGVLDEEARQTVGVKLGTIDVSFNHTFSGLGLHRIEVKLTADGDTISKNNSYNAYVYLEVYNKILVIESVDGSSENLKESLTNGLIEEDRFNIDVVSIDSAELPKTIDGLRAYHQIILNNISNSDLKSVILPDQQEAGGFDKILYSYVYDYGGGLLTTGGRDAEGNAHAYSKEDMFGSIFQDMLPVEATNYTPPLGVVIAIDTSGSMGSGEGSLKQYAFEGAISIARHHLSPDRDYIGLVTFAQTATTRLQMTSAAYKDNIINNMSNMMDVYDGSSTNYAPAIEAAGNMLKATNRVSKKHLIIVTDGQPQDLEQAIAAAAENFSNDITLSIVITANGLNESQRDNMNQLLAAAGGAEEGCKLYVSAEPGDAITNMANDINAPEITKLNPERFNPVVSSLTDAIVKDLERLTDEDGNPTDRINAEVGGFYGTKLKNSASMLLEGVIVVKREVDGVEVEREVTVGVPLYAQWNFGKGKVGSFTSDVYGEWGESFVASDVGKTFFKNAINALMPVTDITPQAIEIKVNGDNYYKQLNVITSLNEGESVTATIVNTSDPNSEEVSLNSVTEEKKENAAAEVVTAIGFENGYGRCAFSIKKSGVYKITLKKLDQNGNTLATSEYYETLSYSLEYDAFAEQTEDDLKTFLDDIADKGKGVRVENSQDFSVIFETFITGFARSFDPRIVFMIIAITAFLLDVAVRKFKFKWPHEIVRDYKEKKKNGSV